MTEPLFPYLPDQRAGPITVDGFTLVLCRHATAWA